MALRFPFEITAEFRGLKAASQFKRRDTGEIVQVDPRLQFEYEEADGSLDIISFSQGQVARAQGADLAHGLKRGDQVVLVGVGIIQDKGSDKDSYVQLVGLQNPEAVRPVKAAA